MQGVGWLVALDLCTTLLCGVFANCISLPQNPSVGCCCTDQIFRPTVPSELRSQDILDANMILKMNASSDWHSCSKGTQLGFTILLHFSFGPHRWGVVLATHQAVDFLRWRHLRVEAQRWPSGTAPAGASPFCWEQIE